MDIFKNIYRAFHQTMQVFVKQMMQERWKYRDFLLTCAHYGASPAIFQWQWIVANPELLLMKLTINANCKFALKEILSCLFFVTQNRTEILYHPANKYMPTASNRNITKRCEICSKITIMPPEGRSGVLIINFEYILYLFLVFLLLNLRR